MTEVLHSAEHSSRPAGGSDALARRPRERELLAWVSLVSLAVGLLGVATGCQGLRLPGLLLFSVIGLGSAPWQLSTRLGLTSRAVLSALTAIVVWTIPSSIMASTGFWRPLPVFATLAAAAAVLHALELRTSLRLRNEREVPPAGRGPDLRTNTSWGLGRPIDGRALVQPVVLAVAGAVLSLVVAALHRDLDPGYFGYAVSLGRLWYAGLAMVLLAVVLARACGERQLAVIVVLLMLVLVLTPSLVYDGPASQSAFKHVDLVDQIRQVGLLHSAVPVYTAWPGFFAAAAWLCDVTGIHDPLRFAVYWPPFIGLFRVAALRGLAGRMLRAPFQRWVVVALVLLADSIKADYFSPQSLGYVMVFLLVAVALGEDIGRTRPAVLLVGGLSLALTHQLSPYVASGLLVVLALFRLVRPWWTPVTVVLPTLAWTFGHWGAIKGQLTLGDIGSVGNFRPPRTVALPGLVRSPVVTDTVLALVIGVGLLAVLALAVFVLKFRDGSVWALGLCSGVGVALVATNPYGQEGIFRAALFAIPWFALLVVRWVPPRSSWARLVALPAVLMVLAATYLVSTTGLDTFTQTRLQDVAALRYAHTTSAGRYDLLRLGLGDVPTSVRPGEYSLDLDNLGVTPEEVASSAPDVLAAHVTSAYGDLVLSDRSTPRQDAYALFSPVQLRYAQAYGLERATDLDRLSAALQASPYWNVVFRDGDTILYQLQIARYAAQQG